MIDTTQEFNLFVELRSWDGRSPLKMRDDVHDRSNSLVE
jgi:hypothetical protein